MSNNKKILIIEDEEALLDMYRLRFEKDGFTVFASDRAREGIEIAKKEKPDLILLDIMMPEMDGYQAVKELKSDPATKDLRVIFLSNMGQTDEIHDGLKLGVEDYIIKASLTPSSLVKKVMEKLGMEDAPITATNGVIKSKNDLGNLVCEGQKVLLIEDNEVIVDMYKMRLEKEGAIVTVAKNGAWGLKEAETGDYHIILLDMVMPAMDGLTAIKALKKNKKTANIPVLVFSNSAQEQDMIAAKKAGAVDYFVKSEITPATVVREVMKFCPNKNKKK